MSSSQHQHDRLAQRLAFIITQLFKGEILSLKLAQEFNCQYALYNVTLMNGLFISIWTIKQDVIG